jgi:hypothetical protein
VEHEEHTVLITDREWTIDTGVSDRGENWDTFAGDLELERDGSTISTGGIEVIASWSTREYATLTYRENGEERKMNGEVVASDLGDGHYYVRFQSFRDPSRAVVVDLFEEGTDIDTWPALSDDADILEGEIVRIGRTSTEWEWEGFLVSVDGLRGNVTLNTFDGQTVVIPGPQVVRLDRKAYTGLVMTDVYIHRTALTDIYITVQSVKPVGDGVYIASVIVREVPAMNFLWVGMGLMSLGVVLRPLEQYGKRDKGEGDDGKTSGNDDGPSGPEDGAPDEESEEDEDS